MCGLAGWIGAGPASGRLDAVRSGGEALRHRGPDDEALLVLEPSGGFLERPAGRVPVARTEPDLPFTLVVAHRRLAILDLGSGGAQPMPSPDERVWLAYNGEIYNHVELRATLTAQGYAFRGRSDTEVLLAAYERWGGDCLERLEGMFAFVLVDRARRRVVLARDHLGQKPLFLCPQPDGLLFASEIPALLAMRTEPARAAPSPTIDYLATGRTDHRLDTMIAGITRLPAGTSMVVSGPAADERTTRRFWSIPDVPGHSAPVAWGNTAAAFRTLFDRSVSWHLRSDVTVGSLLSGGLDSSALVLAQRAMGGPNLDLRAVSYVPAGDAPSEEPWIDMVTSAAACRTEKLRLGPEIWSDAVTTARTQGEPMGSPAILVHHLLCRHAGEMGIKVLLDGQGADELLAGYPAAIPARAASLLQRAHLEEAARIAFAVGGSRRAAAWTLARAAHMLLPWRVPARRPWLTVGRPTLRDALTPLPHPRDVGSLVRRYLTDTLPAILRWEDRNTMAASVEGRLPFLLPELVRFCLALPEAHLVGPGGESKFVLRWALQDLLPAAVRDRRRKVGLAVPLASWARAIPDVAERLARTGELPCVSAEWVRERVQALQSGAPVDGRELSIVWRLVGLDLWREALAVDLSW